MDSWQATSAERASLVSDLLSVMTLEEKLGQLDVLHDGADLGLEAAIVAGAVGGVIGGQTDTGRLQGLATGRSRMGIPLLVFANQDLCDWSPWALAASWDESLCRLAGASVAARTCHARANAMFAPILARSEHPLRASAHIASSDPTLLTRLSHAFIDGVESSEEGGERVIPIVRRLAGNASHPVETTQIRPPHDLRRTNPDFAPQYHEAEIGRSQLFAECSRLLGIVSARYARTSCRSLVEAADRAIEDGEITIAQIDDAARGVLSMKHALDLFRYPDRLVSTDPEEIQRALRQAMRRSYVLLRNDGGLLPLSPVSDRILVVGPGDRATRTCTEALARSGVGHTVAPGLAVRSRTSQWGEVLPGDHFAISLTRDAAQRTDFVLVALDDRHFAPAPGTPWPKPTEAAKLLLDALSTVTAPRIAILFTSSPVDLGAIDRHFSAVMQCWTGDDGAREEALGDILSGRAAPEGRMPVNAGIYPLGHGLGYADTLLSKPRIWREDGRVRASLRVRNLGHVPVREVIQLYGRRDAGQVELLSFAAITLTPGEDGPIDFDVNLSGAGWEIGAGQTLGRVRFTAIDPAAASENRAARTLRA